MDILIDSRMVSNSGIGQIVKNLARYLPPKKSIHRFSFLINESDKDAIANKNGPDLRILREHIAIYSFREQVLLSKEIMRFDPDIVYFPNFNKPLLLRRPSFIAINDLAYWHFINECPSILHHLIAKFFIKHAIINAETIVTLSDYSRRDIIQHTRVDPDKVKVVRPAVDSDIFYKIENPSLIKNRISKYNINSQFILYVGTHQYRKNLLRLIEAFSISNAIQDYKLVITGKITGKTRKSVALVKKLKLEDKVIFTDYVPDKDLPYLYNGASLCVFVSFYEGFGLPVLEAMACQVPLIVSADTAMSEIAGEAALTVNPYSPKEISLAIDRILADRFLKSHLVEKGLKQISLFNWDKTADDFVRLFEEQYALK